MFSYSLSEWGHNCVSCKVCICMAIEINPIEIVTVVQTIGID